MPLVRIKTGFAAADGQEILLQEYLCDWPDCPNVAEQVLGVARDIAMAFAVCPEHASMPHDRKSRS